MIARCFGNLVAALCRTYLWPKVLRAAFYARYVTMGITQYVIKAFYDLRLLSMHTINQKRDLNAQFQFYYMAIDKWCDIKERFHSDRSIL